MDNIQINITSDDKEYQCNLMPCRIKYTGHIRDHFNKDQNYWTISSNNDKVHTFFRGRKLNGTKIELQDYHGFVIQKKDGNYENIGNFKELNNFYNGNDANNYDELIQEWLEISDLLN